MLQKLELRALLSHPDFLDVHDYEKMSEKLAVLRDYVTTTESVAFGGALYFVALHLVTSIPLLAGHTMTLAFLG